jgi:hypothetical protein
MLQGYGSMMETAQPGTLHIIVCGAPPAGEIQDLAKLAQAAGWNVAVIATPNARRFMDIAAIEQFTASPIRSDYAQPGEAESFSSPNAVIVAPATFNTINKWATGIADTFAASELSEDLGKGIPIVVAPCVSEALLQHPAYRWHVELLQDCGVSFMHDPRRYPAPKITPWHSILSELERYVESGPSPRPHTAHQKITVRRIPQLTVVTAKAFWQGFWQQGFRQKKAPSETEEAAKAKVSGVTEDPAEAKATD